MKNLPHTSEVSLFQGLDCIVRGERRCICCTRGILCRLLLHLDHTDNTEFTWVLHGYLYIP